MILFPKKTLLVVSGILALVVIAVVVLLVYANKSKAPELLKGGDVSAPTAPSPNAATAPSNEQALAGARFVFTAYLSGKGYSGEQVEQAWQMAMRYISKNNDPAVQDWLDGLTEVQRQDVLGAFAKALEAYQRQIQ